MPNPRIVLPTEAQINFMLEWMGRVSGGNVTFRLFKNNVIVGPGTVVTDLTEADYTGYVPQDSTLTPPPTAGDGFADVPGDKALSQLFISVFPGNSGSDQIVYGLFCTYSTPDFSDQLLMCSNCFDDQGAVSLVGHNVSGPSAEVVTVTRLRLWDYLQDNNQVPIFKVEGIPNPCVSGVQFDVTVTALNRDRSTNTLSTATVQFFTSDASASGPGPAALVNGTIIVPFTFHTIAVNYFAVIDISAYTGNTALLPGVTFAVPTPV